MGCAADRPVHSLPALTRHVSHSYPNTHTVHSYTHTHPAFVRVSPHPRTCIPSHPYLRPRTQSGAISYAEYMRHMLRRALAKSATRVITIFRLWDYDHNGSINKEEWRRVIKTVGFHAPREDVDALFDDIDRNRTGEIDYEELNKVLRVGQGVLLEVEKSKKADAAKGRSAAASQKQGALSTSASQPTTHAVLPGRRAAGARRTSLLLKGLDEERAALFRPHRTPSPHFPNRGTIHPVLPSSSIPPSPDASPRDADERHQPPIPRAMSATALPLARHRYNFAAGAYNFANVAAGGKRVQVRSAYQQQRWPQPRTPALQHTMDSIAFASTPPHHPGLHHHLHDHLHDHLHHPAGGAPHLVRTASQDSALMTASGAMHATGVVSHVGARTPQVRAPPPAQPRPTSASAACLATAAATSAASPPHHRHAPTNPLTRVQSAPPGGRAPASTLVSYGPDEALTANGGAQARPGSAASASVAWLSLPWTGELVARAATRAPVRASEHDPWAAITAFAAEARSA